MSISEKDIKKLWGLAAGMCSYPNCGDSCIKFIDASDPTVIGEMAHIIAQSKRGPRNLGINQGEDKYDNLILLCPTHHAIVDKAPEGSFPVELLLKWKKDHEKRINSLSLTNIFSSKNELFEYIKKILMVNKSLWKDYGPESEVAERNPVSTAAVIWKLKKIDTIIPNNHRIVSALNRNRNFFNSHELEIIQSFIRHSELFEENSYERMDSDTIPRFPKEFEQLINQVINEK